MSSKKTLHIRPSELTLANYSAKIMPLDLQNSFDIIMEPKDTLQSTPLSHFKTQQTEETLSSVKHISRLF